MTWSGSGLTRQLRWCRQCGQRSGSRPVWFCRPFGSIILYPAGNVQQQNAAPPSPLKEGEGRRWRGVGMRKDRKDDLVRQRPYSAAALVPAIRPKVRQSATALPPRRLPPWMPPVTSPAAYRPGMWCFDSKKSAPLPRVSAAGQTVHIRLVRKGCLWTAGTAPAS